MHPPAGKEHFGGKRDKPGRILSEMATGRRILNPQMTAVCVCVLLQIPETSEAMVASRFYFPPRTPFQGTDG